MQPSISFLLETAIALMCLDKLYTLVDRCYFSFLEVRAVAKKKLQEPELPMNQPELPEPTEPEPGAAEPKFKKAAAIRELLEEWIAGGRDISSNVNLKAELERRHPGVVFNVGDIAATKTKFNQKKTGESGVTRSPARASQQSGGGLQAEDFVTLAGLIQKAGGISRLQEYLDALSRMV